MTHRAYWYVKNHTSQPLIVLSTSHNLNHIEVNPGDSGHFYSFCPAQHLGLPAFDLMMWEIPEEDRYMDIFSAQGVLFKRWYYADRHAAGKQFFDESCWRLYTWDFKYSTQLIYKWVFDIYPEDLFGDDALPEQVL